MVIGYQDRTRKRKKDGEIAGLQLSIDIIDVAIDIPTDTVIEVQETKINDTHLHDLKHVLGE